MSNPTWAPGKHTCTGCAHYIPPPRLQNEGRWVSEPCAPRGPSAIKDANATPMQLAVREWRRATLDPAVPSPEEPCPAFRAGPRLRAQTRSLLKKLARSLEKLR